MVDLPLKLMQKILRKNIKKILMSSKSRKLKAKVLNPARTRRARFECCKCLYASYSARDYKILHKAQKIVFFLFPASSRKVYCHDCLFLEASTRIPQGEDSISLLVEDLHESYILSIEEG